MSVIQSAHAFIYFAVNMLHKRKWKWKKKKKEEGKTITHNDGSLYN